MGNKNSRSRLTRSFEQFDPVAPTSTAAPDALLPPLLGRTSSKTKVAPSPEAAPTDDAMKRQARSTGPDEHDDERDDRVPSINTGTATAPSSSSSSSSRSVPFDFSLTEGQTRRTLMAECEFECSEILPFLFVGGAEVAKSWPTLQQHGITRVVNCSASVVDSHFADREGMAYLSLSMVDGRQDDIAWFVCEVVKFVEAARAGGQRCLLHCEKGISRSCSFAIAYRMWSSGCAWKAAFDFVKSRRTVCSPNTAFTCNLMEIGDLMHAKARAAPVLLRLATHLPHDPDRLVLKLCRDRDTRRLLEPSTCRMDRRGVFVVRARYAAEGPGQGGEQGEGEGAQAAQGGAMELEDMEEGVGEGEGGGSGMLPAGVQGRVYVWHGRGASAALVGAARQLAGMMAGVLAPPGAGVEVVCEGREGAGFWSCCRREGECAEAWDDLAVEAEALAGGEAEGGVDVSPAAAAPGRMPALSVSHGALPALPRSPGLASHSVPTTPTAASPSSTSSFSSSLSPPSLGPSPRTATPAPARPPALSLPLHALSANATPSAQCGKAAGSAASDGAAPAPGLSSLQASPSADRFPEEVGLVRGPTPVEDLLSLAKARSHSGSLAPCLSGSLTLTLPSTSSGLQLTGSGGLLLSGRSGSRERGVSGVGGMAGSGSRDGAGPASTRGLVLEAVPEGAAEPPSHSPIKPRLFQATPVTDSESECVIRVYSWVPLGIYDDDDLQETSALLLCTGLPVDGAGGGSHLWIGADFDVGEVVDLEEEDVEALLKRWACRVVPGDGPTEAAAAEGGAGWLRVLRSLRPEDLVVQLSGQESEGFWGAFNEGF